MFLISLILAIALVASNIAIYIMLPLKSVETYGVTKVEGGRLVVDSTPVGYWTPDKDSIAYFINQWASKVYDINQSTIDQTIKETQELAIGNATKQLTDLRRKTNPYALLAATPGFVRSYERISVNFIKDDVALVRFHTQSSAGEKVTRATYAMTVTFVRIKPVTRDQVLQNPAGLFITNFNVTEEAGS